jgi:hypothetical protein
VTRIDGHGTITLPADYVAEHVQLGYAATEPGNQSDTATRSLTLATPATTCRGLYVAVTRGHIENLILVVTDSHDIADAINTLEHILASDRADLPATSVRRDLATAVPPAPVLQPRCAIPDWFDDIRRQAAQELADAHTRHQAERRHDVELQQRVDQLAAQLDQLAPHCAPHDHAIATATEDLATARQRHRHAEHHLATSGRLHRRTARHQLTHTAEEVATAETALAELTRRAQPLLDQRHELRTEHTRLHQHAKRQRQFTQELEHFDGRLTAAEMTITALDTWHAWATGHTITPQRLIDAGELLRHRGGDHAALAAPLHDWLQHHRLWQPAPSIEPPHRAVESPGLEIGF